jgi:hypothetical protein
MKNIGKITLGLALFIATCAIFGNASTQAATFTVATGNDENTNNASCALSEAIENINDGATTNADCSPTGAYGTNDTINLPTGTITLVADLAEIGNDIVIAGQSKAGSIIDGDSNTYTAFLIGQTAGVANAEFRDFSITGAEEIGIAVCATDLTIDNISVSDSGAGATTFCNNGEETLSITVTDSEFNDNEGIGSGLYATGAGLTLGPAGTCSSTPEVSLSRVRANNNTSPFAGIAVIEVHVGGCTFTTSLEDVEANSNTGTQVSGLTIISSGDAVQDATLDRVTASDNQTIGQTTSPGVAGIYFYASMLTATNLSVSGNIADPEAGSSAAMAGITALALGASANLELSNLTVTDNHLFNTGNLSAPDFSSSGLIVAESFDGSSLLPATFTNVLAANNTTDGSPQTCMNEINLGGGPSVVPMTSGGGNVIEDNTCAYALDNATDQNNVSGLFATLAAPAYNEGFVRTVALLEGSPAIDAGVDVPFSLDAQLLSRSQGTAVDAGAYESPFSAPSSEGGDGESGGGSTLAESGVTVFGIAILSLATLSGAIGISRHSATHFRSHL